MAHDAQGGAGPATDLALPTRTGDPDPGPALPARTIDAWVNVNMGELGRPAYMEAAAAKLFRGGADYWRNWDLAETVAAMDALSIERAVLTLDAAAPSAHVRSFVEARPERFALGATVDPRAGMDAVRALAALAASHPVACARMVPFVTGVAIDDRRCYPVYARCVELGLPITVNTGIPGPPAPADVQDPVRVDPVCRFFPELVLVMAHGADPWWSVACRLMLKYPNLHLMTSAYLPKYLPPELLAFMNTRGRGKVIFASDHPAIPMERCLREAAKLDLRDGVLDAYVHGNAARVFFGEG